MFVPNQVRFVFQLCSKPARLGKAWDESVDKICARRPVSRVLSIGRLAAGWPFIWGVRRRTPRATYPGGDAETRFDAAPIRSCSRWGLPCRPRRRGRGALLPPLFTLAGISGKAPGRAGGLFSVALSLGSPPPGVTRHRISAEPGLSSPRRVSPLPEGGHPAVWRSLYIGEGAQLIKRSRPPSSAAVSASATPSMRAGRKCRWNAARASGSSAA